MTESTHSRADVLKLSMSLTVKSLKELWAKEFLPNIREEIRNEVVSLKAGLQDLRKRFEEIEKSQDFISKKYDTVISTIKDVKEHNDSLKGDIRVIKEDIGKLGNDYLNVEIQLDELEQYARRDCLEITGIPIVPNDNPPLLVKEMSEIMGVNLSPNDISIAHRLPPTKKVKDRLIVKFTRREKRDEIYNNRKRLKSKRTKDLPSVVCTPEYVAVSHKALIQVNESLTPYRKRILGRILQFKRDRNYKFIWTANGKIMLKKTESSITKCFVTHEEFEEFLDQLD
ncbi:hypothetical protein AWC38_SpisGene7936 [Stylophora pistillata]|uniref:FP protein C-terminal domain-containing protein n=1 Tax=Stylophora pistillata TaxID=50429 RepID=A0A2B4SDB1_STYPI|nr:hypothetical protein AWC38_SpisGene7936 [Stylophora pistillata]